MSIPIRIDTHDAVLSVAKSLVTLWMSYIRVRLLFVIFAAKMLLDSFSVVLFFFVDVIFSLKQYVFQTQKNLIFSWNDDNTKPYTILFKCVHGQSQNRQKSGFANNHTKSSSNSNNNMNNNNKKNLKMDKKSYYNYWCRVNWAGSTPTTGFKDILFHCEYRINQLRPPPPSKWFAYIYIYCVYVLKNINSNKRSVKVKWINL